MGLPKKCINVQTMVKVRVKGALQVSRMADETKFLSGFPKYKAFFPKLGRYLRKIENRTLR